MNMKFDGAIVLGGGLEGDSQLKKASVLRADDAINRYYFGQVPNVLFSGGAHLVGADQLLTEAAVMRDYAISAGVPAEAIKTEELSLETIGNACYSKEIVDKEGWEDILVVTSLYHWPRTRSTFRYVYGNSGYNLRFRGVPEVCNGTRLAKEVAGNIAVYYAFLGTHRGNASEVLDELEYLHPRYITEEISKKDLVKRHLITKGKHLLGRPAEAQQAA